jgi:hypothetical protein
MCEEFQIKLLGSKLDKEVHACPGTVTDWLCDQVSQFPFLNLFLHL